MLRAIACSSEPFSALSRLGSQARAEPRVICQGGWVLALPSKEAGGVSDMPKGRPKARKHRPDGYDGPPEKASAAGVLPTGFHPRMSSKRARLRKR
jgi:hypothetical protein